MHRHRFHNFYRQRPAMTLVELLIAVTIVTMLMAVAIPLIRYTLDQDRLRESSRQVNMMLAGARTRAIERGRPVGVWFQRLQATPDAASDLYFAESPPPYAGDVTGAKAYIHDIDADGVSEIVFDSRSVTFSSYVSVGDVVRFNRGGHYFRIDAINTTSGNLPGMIPYAGYAEFSAIFPESIRPALTNLSSSPPSDGISYEILRHPRRLNATPTQLADGTVVDLRFSGVGLEGTQFAFSAGDADHVIVAFDATGALSYLFFDNAPQNVDGPVHLLIGSLEGLEAADSLPTSPNPIARDAVNSTAITYDKNLASQSSIWVTVGSRNGTITTAENGWELFPTTGWTGIPAPPYFKNSLRRAREFAQSTDAMGGR